MLLISEMALEHIALAVISLVGTIATALIAMMGRRDQGRNGE